MPNWHLRARASLRIFGEGFDHAQDGLAAVGVGVFHDGRQLADIGIGGKCAQYIDAHPGIEFWIRNLPRKTASFRLLTPEGWFYPDFVCKLKDGRTLVVEYKGSYLWEGAARKRAIGEVWAARSGGRCLFVMPTDGHHESIDAVIRS